MHFTWHTRAMQPRTKFEWRPDTWRKLGAKEPRGLGIPLAQGCGVPYDIRNQERTCKDLFVRHLYNILKANSINAIHYRIVKNSLSRVRLYSAQTRTSISFFSLSKVLNGPFILINAFEESVQSAKTRLNILSFVLRLNMSRSSRSRAEILKMLGP